LTVGVSRCAPLSPKARLEPCPKFCTMDEFEVHFGVLNGLGAVFPKFEAPAASETTILIVARTNEIINMRWSQIDMERATWTVPPELMKNNKPHVVPLSAPVMAFLRSIHEARFGDFVFPGRTRSEPMSNMTMLRYQGQPTDIDGICGVVKFRSLLTNNNHNLCNLVRNFYRPATRLLERSL
jgi:hypothetical protein